MWVFSFPSHFLWEAPVKQQPASRRHTETQHLPAAFIRSIFIWNWYPQKMRLSYSTVLYCNSADGLLLCFVFLNCAVGGVEGSCLSVFFSRKHMEQICRLARPHSATSHSHTQTQKMVLTSGLLPLLTLCFYYSYSSLSSTLLSYTLPYISLHPPILHRRIFQLVKLARKICWSIWGCSTC